MKNSKKGISLIVLVITIIVIIILAAAVILTLNNNNPIKEANDARYASDVANMQAILTNTVAKIMAANQSTITITATTINDGAGASTPIQFKLDHPSSFANRTNGTIKFTAGNNEDAVESNQWVTCRDLPQYTAGTETWKVDEEGTLTLEAPNGFTYPRVTKTVSGN